jgi:hypothetical protein
VRFSAQKCCTIMGERRNSKSHRERDRSGTRVTLPANAASISAQAHTLFVFDEPRFEEGTSQSSWRTEGRGVGTVDD